MVLSYGRYRWLRCMRFPELHFELTAWGYCRSIVVAGSGQLPAVGTMLGSGMSCLRVSTVMMWTSSGCLPTLGLRTSGTCSSATGASLHRMIVGLMLRPTASPRKLLALTACLQAFVVASTGRASMPKACLSAGQVDWTGYVGRFQLARARQ